MRLTLVLLGHTFDLSLEPTASEARPTRCVTSVRQA
jgi:hypothetical protein